MTEWQAEGLRRLSDLRGRSQAALMREALSDLLADEERAIRVERARAVVGAFRSGSTGTAEDHDAALDLAYGAAGSDGSR